MNLRNPALIGITLLGTACGTDSAKNPNTPDTKTGTVVGRLEASGEGSASSASAYTIGDDGSLTLVGSGSVAADGSFRIDGVEGDGPFVVQLTGASESTIVGQVIVPEDVAEGDEVETAPVSGETTAEAEALVEIVKGEANTDDVDTVGLMTWIDGELADSADPAAAGEAYMSAQEAWLNVSGQTAHGLQQTKLEAWGKLTAKLEAAQSEADASQAWSEFHAQVQAAIESTLDVSSSEQSDAQAAASFVFESAFAGNAESQSAAAHIAASLSAHADFAAQRDALEGQSSELQARLQAAYDEFFVAIDEASSDEQLQSAWADLAVEIHAIATSSSEDFESGFQAAVEAHATLEAKLESAADQADPEQAVAGAYAEFRASIEAAFAGSQSALADFAAEAASQITGHGSIVFDLDLSAILDLTGEPTDPTDIGLDITGAIAGEISGALDAFLVSLDGQTVAEGVIENGNYHFENVTNAAGTLVVELRDGQGNIEGAAVLESITQTEGEYDAATITNETTVEAQTLLARLDDGEDQVDFSEIKAQIDAAIAAAATDGEGDQADLDAIATASAYAADSQANAAVTFAVVVEAIRGQGEDVSEASEAASRIQAALALDAAVQSAFDGSSFEARSAEVHAAVQSFVQSGGGDAAASVFVDALLAIENRMNQDMQLDLVSQTAVQGAFVTSFAAGETFQTALATAFSSSSSGSFGSASGAAQAAFDGSITNAFALTTPTLDQADHEALATFAAHLAVAFSGSYDGTFAD